MGRTKAALAALAVITLLGACGSNGEGVHAGGSPRKLPIAVGGAGAGTEDRAAASTALMPYENRHYVAGKDLPALTGTAPAYELGTIDRDRAARLATALGLGALHDENGSWSATDGTRRLDVSPSGQWSYGSGDASVGVGVVSSDGTPATTVPPTPAADAVRKAVDAFLAEAGLAPGDGDETIEGTYWSMAPKVDGVPAQGFGTYAGVDADATEVQFAGGWLSTPRKVGDYDRIGTAEAVRLLNEGKGHVGPQPMMARAEDAAASSSGVARGAAEAAPTTAVAAASCPPDATTCIATSPPAPVTTACAPDGTCGVVPPPTTPPCPPPGEATTTVTVPPPRDVTITITDADAVLVLAPSWDGKRAYLVPAYRLHDDSGGTDVVLAIGEDLIEPPPSTTVPPDSGTGKAEPGTSGAGSSGSTGSAGAPGQVEPAPPATEPAPNCP